MQLKCLLDTNILIQLEEPGSDGKFREGFSELLRICHKNGIRVFYHPSSKTELERDPNVERRKRTSEWIKRYPPLEHAPTAEKAVLDELFGPANKSNDLVDSQILYSVHKNAVDYLISQDDGLRSKATRSDLGNRTFSVLEFVNYLKKLFEPEKVFIPNIEETRTYKLDRNDSIFSSLRERYAKVKFEEWLDKCDSEDRVTWIVRDKDSIAALAIVKPEDPRGEGIPELKKQTLKVCTFKVANDHRGGKLGELLLKQVFSYAIKNQFDSAYMTFFSEQEYLSLFLKDFGFQVSSETTDSGEFIYFKVFSKPDSKEPRIGAKDFHIKYCPWHYADSTIKKYIIPIVPKFHEALFPELYSQQLTLGLQTTGTIQGNSLKKVYISNSPTNQIDSGSLLYFYCSREAKILTTVGIVERSLKTDDLNECLQMIGKRSVYTLKDVEDIVRKRALIIDFRLAYHLEKTIAYSRLTKEKIINGPTLSVTELTEEAFKRLKGLISPDFSY